MSIIDNLETLLKKGQDNAVLRFSLGNEYLKAGDTERSTAHLQAAVKLDPDYSAAWKALGKVLSQCGAPQDALKAYTRGIAAAEQRGDKQAAKEMQVFKRRVERSLSP
jgi:Tfp pilus assembly protein PilF